MQFVAGFLGKIGLPMSKMRVPMRWSLGLLGLCALLLLTSFLWKWRLDLNLLSSQGEACTNGASFVANFVAEGPNPGDDRGILRAAIRDKEVLVGQPVCVVVAGAGSALALQTLANAEVQAKLDCDRRNLEYAAAQRRYGELVDDTNAKAEDAAKAEAAANTAELKASSPNAQKADADDAANLTQKSAGLAKDRETAISAQTTARQLLTTAQTDQSNACSAYVTAFAANANGPPPVELTPFLDQHRASDATLKVRATPKPQAMEFNFGMPADATTSVATFWRDVLSAGTDSGEKTVTFGLTRGANQISELQSAPTFKIHVYYLWPLMFGALAIILLATAIVILAINTSILRNNNLMEDGRPTGTWSLGRVQMALWMVIVLAGYLFFWFALGEYLNVINASILVLLGLNSATGLLAATVEGSRNDNTKTSGFFLDILCDSGGAQLQRLQMVLWTSVLAAVFIWNVTTRFNFVTFDAYLLLLMGIAQATYIGFKPGEDPKTLTIEPLTATLSEEQIFTIRGGNLDKVTKVAFVGGTNPKEIDKSGFTKQDTNLLQVKAALDEKVDWTAQVEFEKGDIAKVQPPVKVIEAPTIEPLTAVLNKEQAFTIRGDNLDKATKVAFVGGTKLKEIQKSSFTKQDTNLIEVKATLDEKVDWTVEITFEGDRKIKTQSPVTAKDA